MARTSTYLNFTRHTEEAFTFYQSIFGTEFVGTIARLGDVPPQPGQPEQRNQDAAAMSIAARLNLVSADLAFKDKSLLGRLIKREAERAQSTEAAIKAQYRAQLTALRDQQTDPLARDAIDAVMAFLENPGELVVTVRPPTPLNLVAVAGLAASNAEQLRSMLGITIVAKRP